MNCGSCTTCCRSGLGVLLGDGDDLSLGEPVRIIDKDTGGEHLGYRIPIIDGACKYVGEAGCTVYERRPAVCRKFDCRNYTGNLKPIIDAARR